MVWRGRVTKKILLEGGFIGKCFKKGGLTRKAWRKNKKGKGF